MVVPTPESKIKFNFLSFTSIGNTIKLLISLNEMVCFFASETNLKGFWEKAIPLNKSRKTTKIRYFNLTFNKSIINHFVKLQKQYL